MIPIVAATLAACAPSDFGAMGGVELRSESAGGGVDLAPTFAVRLSAELRDCVGLPLRAETHLNLTPAGTEEAGAVELQTTSIGLPVLIGLSWPKRAGGGFYLVTLVGPELRYETVNTRVLDTSQRDNFWGFAGLAHGGLEFVGDELRLGLRGFARLDDPFSYGSLFLVDLHL